MNDYISTCESAATRLPVAVEFERLFPEKTDHFITHFGFNRHGGDPTNTWNSEAYFYGRYVLTMQVEVVVDYKDYTVTPAGEPIFYLEEVTKYDGRVATHEGLHATFGKREWKKIYDNGGDFSILGVAMLKDMPIPGFDQFVKAMRRPRVPISLLRKKVVDERDEISTMDGQRMK